MHRRLALTALLAAASLVAGTAGSACSAGGNAADTETEGAAGGTGPSATSGSGAGTDRTPSSGAGEGRPGAGTSIGTTRAQLRADAIDETAVPLRIDVVRLRASGELVELELALTNEATAAAGGKKAPNFQANSLFADGQGYDMSAVGLVDANRQKLYLPVFDSEDKCLCTGDLGATEFAPGGTYTLAATFGGVPRDVDTLDVRIPQFPAVTGVRVER
jgi:hypothetical protein